MSINFTESNPFVHYGGEKKTPIRKVKFKVGEGRLTTEADRKIIGRK
jgi:hypothetical protein